MSDVVKTFRGTVTVTFADGSTETYPGGNAVVYEHAGLLKVTDASKVDHLFSPNFWSSVTDGTPKKPAKPRIGTIY